MWATNPISEFRISNLTFYVLNLSAHPDRPKRVLVRQVRDGVDDRLQLAEAAGPEQLHRPGPGAGHVVRPARHGPQ